MVAGKNVVSVYEGIRNDYEAAKNSRFIRRRTGLAPGGGPADYHFRSEPQFYDIMERARDMDRNDALVGQSLDRVVANVVQGGFTLIPQTGKRDLDLLLWNIWNDFATNPEECDIAGEMNFHDYEKAALRACMLDGDCLIAGTDEGPLQFFEAHCIGTSTKMPNTFLGVTLGPNRERHYYWIAKDKVGAVYSNRRENAVPLAVRDEFGVKQLFHVMDKKRETLTRGVSHLAPAFPISAILEDANFAKLVQQQSVSCFAYIIEKAKGTNTPPSIDDDARRNEQTTEQSLRGRERIVDGVQPAMTVEGNAGETIKGFSPNVPNNEWFQHFRQQVAMFGATLDLTPSQVTLDFSLENFVGYRGATHEARKGLKRKQDMLKSRFHTPVYVWKIQNELRINPELRRLVKLYNVNPLAHKWQAPAFDYLEPVNDAAADLLRVRNGLTSRRRLHAERSQDWEEIAEESVEDNAYAIVKAIQMARKINKKFPDNEIPITWMHLINLPTPDGVNLGMSVGQKTEQPKLENKAQ